MKSFRPVWNSEWIFQGIKAWKLFIGGFLGVLCPLAVPAQERGGTAWEGEAETGRWEEIWFPQPWLCIVWRHLVGMNWNFDWKIGTKQLLHSSYLTSFPITSKPGGSGEGARVLSGPGPCGRRIRTRGFVENWEDVPSPHNWHGPSAGHSWRASHSNLWFGVQAWEEERTFPRKGPRAIGLITNNHPRRWRVQCWRMGICLNIWADACSLLAASPVTEHALQFALSSSFSFTDYVNHPPPGRRGAC